MQSGLVDGLLQFCTDESHPLQTLQRQKLVYEVFSLRSTKISDENAARSPLAILVKRLQESLTRIESFEVVTVSSGVDDSKRNSASILARQLRLRLVAEGSDIPRNCSNITVSIHAIATFQALNDYLRPRISGLGASIASSRMSGVLAAFAAAAGLPPGALSRGANTPSSSKAVEAEPPADATDNAAGPSDAQRGPRRSRRLSGKDPVNESGDASSSADTVETAAQQALDEFLNEEFGADVGLITGSISNRMLKFR